MKGRMLQARAGPAQCHLAEMTCSKHCNFTPGDLVIQRPQFTRDDTTQVNCSHRIASQAGEGGNICNAGVDLGMALLTEIGHPWEMNIDIISVVCLSPVNSSLGNLG